MTEKYNTKNYKPGYSPSRLQHNYKMTYENAYNLAQDLNNVFNRLYTVEQEKKEYRKETERLQKELAEAIEQNQINVYEVTAQAAEIEHLKELARAIQKNYYVAIDMVDQAKGGEKDEQRENARLREALKTILDATKEEKPSLEALRFVAYTALKGGLK